MTGPFLRLDLRGRGGETIQEHWAEAPSSYLGLMVHGFPNLFTITGPGSTFGNHAVTMELHVEWIADCIAHLREHGIDAIEPTEQAEQLWGEDLVAQVAQTVVAQGSSWWSGENIPGRRSGHFSRSPATSTTAASATRRPSRGTSSSSARCSPTPTIPYHRRR